MKYKAFLMFLVGLFFAISAMAQEASLKKQMEMDPEKSILSNTKAAANYKMLLAGMKAADLEDILSYDGPFTVFAPSDTAFRKLSKETLEMLMLPANKRKLQTLMTHHIIAGNFSASKILMAMSRGGGKASFTTVQGNKLIASMDGLDIILVDEYGNTARIINADSNQCNGVIHEIDTVILPSSEI